MRIPFAQENGTLLSQQHIEMFYFEFFGILSVITSSPSLLPQKDKRRQYINTYACVCVCVCVCVYETRTGDYEKETKIQGRLLTI